MTDKVVPITTERRQELKSGLLYDYEETFVRSTILVEDATLREGIDAATEYLESRGRKIRSIMANKVLLLIPFVIGFSIGVYLTMAIIYSQIPEEMNTLFGF